MARSLQGGQGGPPGDALEKDVAAYGEWKHFKPFDGVKRIELNFEMHSRTKILV